MEASELLGFLAGLGHEEREWYVAQAERMAALGTYPLQCIRETGRAVLADSDDMSYADFAAVSDELIIVRLAMLLSPERPGMA